MKIRFTLSLVAVLTMASLASAATVWNPAANPNQTPPFNYNDPANWTKGLPTTSADPDTVDPPSSGKAVLNVPNAAEAQVTDAQTLYQLVQGDNNVGGVLRVMNGGSLTTGSVWSGVGYNDEAHLIIETGGTVTFGQHLWVGLLEGLGGMTPTVDVDGGTLHVTSVLGLNWNTDGFGAAVGEDSIVNVINGGEVNVDGRLDLGNIGGLGTININSGGVVNAAHMKNDGTIIVGNGGQLITPPGQWVSIGQRDTGVSAVLEVEAGGLASFGQHLWVGFENPNAEGTINIGGSESEPGTVSVGQMLGLGWGAAGGTGIINVNDYGVLELTQLHGDGMKSVEPGSELNINGTGKVTLPGNYTAVVTAYINNGKIFANGSTGDVNLFSIDVLPNPEGVAGDFNGDGIVDAADYTVFRDNLDGDSSVLNGNGSGGPTVVAADYDLWVANFGEEAGQITIVTASNSPAVAGVPEPSTLMMASAFGAFALAGIARRQRR